MNVNVLSSKTVISTGTFRPFSTSLVFSLKALQKSIIFSPCWPKAGPTGGLGFAPPAGTCSFIIVITSFAILIPFLLARNLILQEWIYQKYLQKP